MITKEQAFVIARKYLDQMEGDGLRLALIAEITEEHDFGWLFFYQSKEYVETGNMDCFLIGNAPFIVNNQDGNLHVTGTAHQVEYYIEKYRKKVK